MDSGKERRELAAYDNGLAADRLETDRYVAPPADDMPVKADIRGPQAAYTGPVLGCSNSEQADKADSCGNAGKPDNMDAGLKKDNRQRSFLPSVISPSRALFSIFV